MYDKKLFYLFNYFTYSEYISSVLINKQYGQQITETICIYHVLE